MRRTQSLTKRPKFLQQLMSNCYNGYMVNNNNNVLEFSPDVSGIWTELSGYRISNFSSDVNSCNSTLCIGYIHFETKTAGLNPDYPIRLPDIRSSQLSEHLSGFLDSGMARGIKFSQFGRIQRIHQVLIRFHAEPVLRL